MKTTLTTLPSGLRVATCEIPHAETAAMAVWAGVGGRHEPPKLNGISHFIEHMLFKGTKRRTPRRIMEEVEGVGGDMNAYTSEERTCYYATAAVEFFPRICDVLSDIYVNPRFSPQDIERERGVIGEEILMYQDDPSSHVQETLNLHYWKNHALGRPLAGTVQSVNVFTREDMLDYRASHYHAGSTVVSVAGKVTHEEVLDRVGRLMSDIPARRKLRPTSTPKLPAKLAIIAERRDIQQTQVAIGLPGLSQLDPRRYALQILHVILGGNASSRLFQELREKRGLCYSVSTHPSFFHDVGMMNLSLGLDHRNLEKSLRLIQTAFADLRSKPVRPTELRRAKEYAVGTSRMALERTGSQNMRLGGSILAYGKIVDPDEVHARLRQVTAEEIQAVATDLLDLSRATIALIGPSDESKNIERLLAK